MARVRTFQFLFAALLLAGVVPPAQALQLGEGKAEILSRHGIPGAEDRAKNVAIYFWEGWSAELEYKNEAIQKLIYRRNSYLEEKEVAALLQSNGGGTRWREMTPAGEPTRQWVRDDGAVASCLALRPLMMTFQAPDKVVPPVPRYSGAGKPKNVVPAATVTGSSTPPTFPKLLGSSLETESEAPSAPMSAPALPPMSTTPPPANPPMARPLPKLQAEEVNSEPAAPAPEKPRGRKAWELPVTSDDAPADAPKSVSESPAVVPVDSNPSSGTGWVSGVVALLVAAAAGAGYWFKFKRTPSPARFAPVSSPVVRSESPQSARATLATTPALDALRSDQFDLLVGEIFRREGYTVEISAATGQGDTIDLTLRRDSETILVQCKHWKTSRVTEREIREFHSAMMANGAPRGIFVTAGAFAREAQEFAVGKDIDLMDRTALEECTASVARPGEDFCGIKDWVDEFTANARIFDPECPICHGTMVIRHHRANGAASWTCRSHPRCPGRREARLDLLHAAAAH